MRGALSKPYVTVRREDVQSTHGTMKTGVPRARWGALRRVVGSTIFVTAAIVTACISTCSPERSALEKVRTMGVLRVATINSPTTFYIDANGPTGYEYDLAKGFADRLGLRLEMIVAGSHEEVISKVVSGAADLGAAGLAITSGREQLVRFSEPVSRVVPQLIYRTGQPRPSNLDDLKGKLAVPEGSNEAQRLLQLRQFHPDLRWESASGADVENLLEQVSEGQLDYTIANSDIVAINQRYFPKLAVAFPLSETQQLGWALRHGPDDSLFAAAADYLRDTSGPERDRLRDRYFGKVMRAVQFSSVTLAADTSTRLPRYQKWFEQAAERNNLDWRLLAAVGYQESHWDPTAVSPTGVRGLMMLTENTARELKVTNREDPLQSIDGGARYIRMTLEALPDEIKEPDRSWLALAAYNIGMGHLIDARKLTQQRGGNPNHWVDVRATLPLLTQQRWFSKTDFGYARGHETVTFVGNIRTYYDMLVWMTTERPPARLDEDAEPAPKKEKKKKDPLNINAPVL
jgi:membrane-bound lytic murein transglycosylase F